MTRWRDLTADQQLGRRVKVISNCYYMLAGLFLLFVALGIMGVLLALRRGATAGQNRRATRTRHE